MQESAPVPTIKPGRYVLVFTVSAGPADERRRTLTIHPQNDPTRPHAATVILLDKADYLDLFLLPKKLKYTDSSEYPFYRENVRSITIIEHLYGYDHDSHVFLFKNGNKYDLTRGNVMCRPIIYPDLLEKLTVIDYVPGHSKAIGQQAHKMKNPLWRTREGEGEGLVMYCEKDTLCRLCPVSYQKILDYENEHNGGEKLTFYKQSNGYISTHALNGSLYIHQVITGCYGNGKGTKTISVDHIDQDPLNNTFDNLRVVSQAVQMGNSKGIKEGTKRARKKDAIPLPEGITEDMIPKYATYYLEPYGTGGKTRSFFRVEKHPALVGLGKRDICTSKSNKVADQDKLAQAAEIVEALDAGTYVEKQSPLPMYFSMIHMREKPHLVYERRLEDGTRQNLKMVLPAEYDVGEQLERMRTKLTAKYEDVSFE